VQAYLYILIVLLLPLVGCRARTSVSAVSGPTNPVEGTDEPTATDGETPDLENKPESKDAKLSPAFTINGDASVTSSRNVKLQFTAPKGIKRWRISDNTGAPKACGKISSKWTTFLASGLQPVSLSSVQGIHRLCVEVDAGEGTKAFAAFDDIKLDSAAVTTTFALATPPQTNMRTTTIAVIDAEAGASKRFSVTGNCDAASWTLLSGDFPVTLPDSDAVYSLCVQARDLAGNVGEVQTFGVTLDRSAPVGGITTTGNLGPGYGPGDHLAIAGTVTDSLSGLLSPKISITRDSDNFCLQANLTFQNVCPVKVAVPQTGSAWSAMVATTDLTNANYTIELFAGDLAGNLLPPTTSAFTWYLPPPVALVPTAPEGSSNLVNLSLPVTGVGVETYDYKFGADATTDCTDGTGYTGTFIDASTPVVLDLTLEADGDYILCVRAKDEDDNEQTLAGATQIVWTKDTLAPGLVLSSPLNGATVNAATAAAVTLTGTCAENGNAVIATSGTATAQANCASNSFSFAVNLTAVADGAPALSIAHTDTAGNLATVTINLVKDTVAPSVTITTPAANGTNINSINMAAIAVGGSCSEDTLNVVITGDAVGTVACATGAWSTTLDFTGAADGTASITIGHSDAAGNSASAATRTFNKDTGLPTVSVTTPAANGSYINNTNKSAIAAGGACSETTRNVVITGDATSTVTCTAGSWTASLNFSGTADGTPSISVAHQDAAGNNAIAATRSFNKDTGLPTVTVTTPAADGSAINNSNKAAITVGGSCSEDTRNVVITGDASATIACASGAWTTSLNFTAAADGARSISVAHQDIAGNSAVAATRSFIKDTALPTVSVTTPAANGSYINDTNKAAVTVGGACSENTQNVVITGDAADTVTCTALAWTASLNFTAAADGTRSISVAHQDASGNSAVAATRSFVKDTGLPTVSVTTPAADGSAINNTNKAAITVSGACSEDTRNVVITGDASATVACASGAWTTSLNFSAAADGTPAISIAHQDAAGNSAVAATRSFAKDTGLPIVTVTTPAANGSFINDTNKAAVTVAGACSEDTRDVVITGDASDTVACASGSWTTALNFTAAADGTRSITVNHTDASGNSAVAANRSFTKDTGLPTVTVTAPAADGSAINEANKAAVAVGGACSEDTRNIVITGDAAATVACASGAWSTTLNFTAAAEGTRSISVAHQDAAGNNATAATRSFVKDTGLPTVTVTTPAADGSYINNANKAAVAVAGTCSEDTRSVVITGDATGSVACGSGSWSTTLNFTAAADGTRSISVAHQDASGNSAVAATRSFTKDIGLPTVTITTPAANGTVINNSNKAAISVGGACSEDTINVVITGDATGSVACASGSWSTSLDFTLAADGTRLISVAHQDAAGNNAVAATRSFTKDTGLPTVSVTTPAADGSYINNTNKSAVSVGGACSEDTRNVVITGDATGTVACASGSWSTSLNFTAAAEGTRSISVAHQDSAGNSAVAATRSFNKDTALPTVTVTTPAANGSAINNTNKAAISVGGACSEDTGNVVITGDATGTVACASGSWSTTLDFTAAADGTRSISVAHQDAAGNNAVAATRSFAKDTGLPTVTITTPAANGSTINNTNKAAISVGGACSEDTINVVITGDASGSVACVSGSWSTSLDFTLAADGTRSISIAHQDAAGNNAVAATRSFSKDTGLPTVSVTTPAANGSYINNANKAAVSVGGACSEDTVNVVITGDASGTIACSSGTWSTSLNFTGAADGTRSISVAHQDAAGNNATPATRSFAKDTGNPTVSVTTPAADGSYINNANKAAVSVGGACSEDTINVVITGDATGTVACASGTWSTSLNFTAAADGTRSISVAHQDAAGNSATAATRSFAKDTGNPTVTVTNPAADGTYVNAANQNSKTFAGGCSDAVTISISGAVTDSMTCTGGLYSFSLDLTSASAGTVTMYADLTDAAGNVAPTITRTIIKDILSPNTPAAPTDAGAYTGSTVTFNWSSVTDNGVSGVASYYLQVGTTAGASNVLDQNVGNVLTYDISGTSGVTYYARVRAVDAAGNVSSYSSNSDGVMVDGTAPTGASTLKTAADANNGPNVSYDNDTGIFLVWTAGSDAHSGLHATAPYEVTWYATNNCTSTATTISNITNTYTSLAVANGGVYTFRVKTTDAAGNNVTSGCSTSITIDTVAPPALATFSGVTGATSTAINLSWTNPGSTADYASIKIYRSASSVSTGVPAPACGTGTLATTITNFATLSYVDTTGESAKYFSYRACVYDLADNVTSSNTAIDVLSRVINYVTYYDALKKNLTTETGDIGTHTTSPWQDLGTNNNDGTLTNFNFNTANSGWDGSGTSADPYVLKFDGSNDYVTTANTAAAAYAVWFKPDSTTNGGGIFSSHYSYAKMSGGNLAYTYSADDGSRMDGTFAISPDSWYHFVMTFDGTNTCAAYINGFLIQTDASCNLELAQTRYLGYDSINGYHFDGSIGSFKSYASGLTAAQVLAMYDEELPRYAADPGVTQITRIIKGYGATGGGSTMTVYGWDMNDVTAVQIDGASASFTVDASNKLSVTMPAGTIGWQDISVVGSATHTVPAARYTGTAINTLVHYLDAENIDTIGMAASGPLTRAKWSSLVDFQDLSLNNFNFNTANSGWDGNATPANPSRLKFDGTNDSMSISSTQVQTYAVWFNADNTSNGGSVFSNLYSYARMSGGNLTYAYSADDGTSMQGTFTITPATWYHFVMTFDGTNTCAAYINGVSIQLDTTCNLEWLQTRYVGYDPGNGYYFDGSIGSFKSYSSGLTAAQVLAMYDEELPRYATDPGVSQITRVSKGYGPAAGGNVLTLRGWSLDDVTSVEIDGVSASFTPDSTTKLSVTMPPRTLGWQDISIIGGGGDTATSSALYTATAVNTLVHYFSAENIDTIGLPASAPLTRSSWDSLVDEQSLSLVNFNFNTVASGWDGDGTTGSPYRLKFDGTNDYSPISSTQVQTYAVWFRADNITNSGSVVSNLYSYVRMSGSNLTYAYSADDATSMQGTYAISTGTWYHFVMTYDGANTCTAYVNGASIQTDTSCNLEWLQTRYVGYDPGNGYYFDGAVQSLKTYSTGLTAGQVTTMFNEEKVIFGL
jgi:hypothetical protein